MSDFSSIYKNNAEDIKKEFLQTFRDWVQSEVKGLMEEITRVKAVAVSRYGIESIADATLQSFEDTMAEELGVD